MRRFPLEISSKLVSDKDSSFGLAVRENATLLLLKNHETFKKILLYFALKKVFLMIKNFNEKECFQFKSYSWKRRPSIFRKFRKKFIDVEFEKFPI